jgi:hypothetical protein
MIQLGIDLLVDQGLKLNLITSENSEQISAYYVTKLEQVYDTAIMYIHF